MNLGLDHQYISSFKEQLDHTITKKLQAFKNVTLPLFLDTKDDRMSNYKIAGGGTRQWVYDSSVPGATIASLAGAGNQWTGGHVDFKNNRILGPSSFTAAFPATLAVAQKHFNVYTTTKSDEDLFANMEFGAPVEVKSQTKAVKADSYYAPCIFVKFGRTFNEGFALGGEDATNIDLKVTVFCRTEAELIAVGGVIRDMARTVIWLLDDTPLNEFNDLKARPWSFEAEQAAAALAGQPRIHIEDVYFNPIKSDALASKFPNVSIGLGSFKTFMVRNPRQ